MYTNLKVEMVKQGLTIRSLSALCGIPYATLINKLSKPDGQGISIKQANIIREVLGVENIPIEELFAWEEK